MNSSDFARARDSFEIDNIYSTFVLSISTPRSTVVALGPFRRGHFNVMSYFAVAMGIYCT
jgi:hypothetical protein